MPKKKILILTLSVLLISAIILKIYRNKQLVNTGKDRNLKTANITAIDSFSKIIKAGDVVFRRGADAISDMFVGLNHTNKSFSHLGIVLQDGDSTKVYHSIGGEDNPDEKIRVESFAEFVTPKYNLAMGYIKLPLNNIALIKLDSIVKLWHKQQRTFDMKFDLKTDEKLYCAEFVYKAYRLAAADTNLFSVSKTKNLIYIAPDNILLEKTRTAFGMYKFE